MIYNETDLFRKILGKAYPSPGTTQAEYRNLIRDTVIQVSGETVTCSFEVEGVMFEETGVQVVELRQRRGHYLSYPFKQSFFHTTINLLEHKARTSQNEIIYVLARAEAEESDESKPVLWPACPSCGATLVMDDYGVTSHLDKTQAPH